MENSFDVELVREYSARQRADADRIMALCDALKNTVMELESLRAKMKAAKEIPAPANPDNGK